jgi:hypothetical protein
LPHTPPKNFFEKKFSGLSKNLNNFSEVFEVSKEPMFGVFGLARNGGVKPPRQTRRSLATIFFPKSFFGGLQGRALRPFLFANERIESI